MLSRPIPTERGVRRNAVRRQVLGRLLDARVRLSSQEGQKAQRIVNTAIREVQALIRQDEKFLGSLARTSALPVDDYVMLAAFDKGREIPLVIAYHMLSEARIPSAERLELGILRRCREACRGACIKADLGDPRA